MLAKFNGENIFKVNSSETRVCEIVLYFFQVKIDEIFSWISEDGELLESSEIQLK